ncbi:MAG: ribonuclease R [Gammaproteobacteria bacterium]|nr:ribonuclease R [Gammaproteobacteria bacterium]
MSKPFPQDPHAEREAQKYAQPIPSREFILALLEQAGKPLRRQQIATALQLEGEEQLDALQRRLRAMERDGQLLFNRRNEYCLATKVELITGRVVGHSQGFGFVIPDQGGDDLMLPAHEMRAVMHGDRVAVREVGVDRRGRREAMLVEVLERAQNKLVGRLFIESGVGFVIADNKRIHQDILIPHEAFNGANHGQIVMIEITEFPTKQCQAIGKVTEVLGEHMAPGMEIDIAIRSYGLPQAWPGEVTQEIASLSPEVREDDKFGREDLRHLALVTIDGEDARDFDDAVYCKTDGKGWRLYVAIADVSHYVKSNTALDAEAKQRGTSVYFPERVIPMLPEILSNGLCSLNPQTDRLCIVCEMDINARGMVKAYRFSQAIMHSKARLTYTKVAAIVVERDAQLRQQYAGILAPLDSLYALFKVLHQARNQRGAIDFDSTETRIVFGADRKIDRIVPLQRNDAHRLIEECMLLANVAAANYLAEHKIPILYRNHEPPSAERLADLREFLGSFGLSLAGGEAPEPKHFTQLIERVRQRPDSHLLETVMLRSLKQAMYSPDNAGHFGLAYPAYTHFTSPIRRYPDLLVHRAIRHLLQHKNAKSFTYSHADMLMLGDHCSKTERRADEATRDVMDWLKCEYMQDKLGTEYEGIISSVTNFGLFVSLSEVYVEGLVHITGLPSDYYQFDPVQHRLIGERTARSFRLGDPIRVRVSRVDLDERKLDFELTDHQPTKSTDRSAGKARVGPGDKPTKGHKQRTKKPARASKSTKANTKPAAIKSTTAQDTPSKKTKRRRSRR